MPASRLDFVGEIPAITHAEHDYRCNKHRDEQPFPGHPRAPGGNFIPRPVTDPEGQDMGQQVEDYDQGRRQKETAKCAAAWHAQNNARENCKAIDGNDEEVRSTVPRWENADLRAIPAESRAPNLDPNDRKQ